MTLRPTYSILLLLLLLETFTRSVTHRVALKMRPNDFGLVQLLMLYILTTNFVLARVEC